jgi:hypothetical protein
MRFWSEPAKGAIAADCHGKFPPEIGSPEH